MSFPFYKQLDSMDCGPASLRIVASYYGKHFAQQHLRELCHITREGVSMLGISDAAEAIGFRTMGVRITFEQLANEAVLPCIVHWNQRHFVVVYKVKKTRNGYDVYVSDPAKGLLKYTQEAFLKSWQVKDNLTGEVVSTHADCRELWKRTGYRPDTSLLDGIKAFVNWYKTN